MPPHWARRRCPPSSAVRQRAACQCAASCATTPRARAARTATRCDARRCTTRQTTVARARAQRQGGMALRSKAKPRPTQARAARTATRCEARRCTTRQTTVARARAARWRSCRHRSRSAWRRRRQRTTRPSPCAPSASTSGSPCYNTLCWTLARCAPVRCARCSHSASGQGLTQ